MAQEKTPLQKLREEAPAATFQDLIAQKLRRNQQLEKAHQVYVPSMGKTLPFRHPGDEVLLELSGEMDTEDAKRTMAACRKLIYLSCELLQDAKLHEALEVDDPYDVVSALMGLEDISEVADQLSVCFGIGEAEEALKNGSSATGI